MSTKEERLLQPAGPGAVTDIETGIKPLLNGASEFEYVDIYNPLPVDFIGVFASSKPVNMPAPVSVAAQVNQITKTEEQVRQNYGLDLRNQDHQAFASKVNIQNKVPIKSGQTIRLLGNEAQVIVRQLVTEILQREGRKLSLADPTARREVEERVIRYRGDAREALGRDLETVPDQLQSVKEKGQDEERPFQDLQTTRQPQDDPGNGSGPSGQSEAGSRVTKSAKK